MSECNIEKNFLVNVQNTASNNSRILFLLRMLRGKHITLRNPFNTQQISTCYRSGLFGNVIIRLIYWKWPRISSDWSHARLNYLASKQITLSRHFHNVSHSSNSASFFNEWRPRWQMGDINKKRSFAVTVVDKFSRRDIYRLTGNFLQQQLIVTDLHNLVSHYAFQRR